jgi:four helix bundle protein
MSEKNALPFAKGFRDLVVYQRQRELARQVFAKSKRFPAEEKFALTDQIRRASRSIGAQIAEAWAKRAYERHFISKLTDADAEQQETQHWIETAHDCEYLAQEESGVLLGLCSEIGRMLQSMQNRAADFCPNPLRVREDPETAYFESRPDTEH